jgi:deoxyribodipyrimidine photo-lyase
MKLQVVWFKRDLRWEDHAPLSAAVATGQPVVALLLHESSLWAQPVYSNRHACFEYESAAELFATRPLLGELDIRAVNAAEGRGTSNDAAQGRGTSNDAAEGRGSSNDVAAGRGTSNDAAAGRRHLPFFYVAAEATEAFEALEAFAGIPIGAVFSHQEIGIETSFARDRHMKKWFKKRGITWHESPYGSVRRGLKRRDDWNAYWNEVMFKEPLVQADWALGQAWTPSPPWINWAQAHKVERPAREAGVAQTGGAAWGHRYLRSFVAGGRGRGYMAHISKPEGARSHCSRLSPYLAWGNLSLKQVVRNLSETRSGDLLAMRDARAFASRLRWREHFIQKFESEPRMEFEHVNRGYNQQTFSTSSAHLNAWKLGQTGVPMVDACMRSLNETGYLNFRMRAMLVSFGCHALNLNWKDLSAHLAQQFLDFEPGIHYPQLQMQAAVTGVNTVRIYNPVKQAEEQDPHGAFIERWVPELAPLPMPFRAAPWMLTEIDCVGYGFQFGTDYPAPLVDLTTALRDARIRLYGAKKRPEVRAEKNRILEMHVAPQRKKRG